MSPSPERLGTRRLATRWASARRLTPRLLAAGLVVGSALVAGAGSPAWADPAVPPGSVFTVEDLVFPVEDIVPETESMDGTESESKSGEEVTVALTSDVLFALDKSVLTPRARKRLEQVAAKIQAESTGGVVKVEGHTDDQGTDAYNNVLSLKRAQAVRQALQGKLSGVTFQAKGFGETRPKLPNIVQGRPIKENRAKNRRVEIIFTTKQ
ncbi:OmpA family protein [Sphaerisporangium viridialbum]|uniref:OmpA family protein n=1 Tax=Sphaerisporangium viridialbum TaxID=46189 RepID=UPI003C786B8C